MKKWTSIAALGLLVIFFGCTKTQNVQSSPRISKDELKAKLGKPDLFLIDVRTDQWEIAAEQLNLKSVWQYACEHIITTVTGFRLKSSLLLTAQSGG